LTTITNCSGSQQLGVVRWGRGDIAPNLGLAPKCDELKAGAKRSVLWPSKYAKMPLQPGLSSGPSWEAHNAPPDH